MAKEKEIIDIINVNLQAILNTKPFQLGLFAGIAEMVTRSDGEDSVNYACQEYTRFKNKFLEIVANDPTHNFADIPGTVDKILKKINAVKKANIRRACLPFLFKKTNPI